MLLEHTVYADSGFAADSAAAHYAGDDALEPWLQRELLRLGWPLQRRRVRAKQHVFRAGQPRTALYLVHAGCFKTALVSEDGREKITGFRLRGDLLGLDALDMNAYACDAVALDTGELWEVPFARLRSELPSGSGTQALLGSASELLSAMTHFVGVVSVPKREQFAFRRIEFVPLDAQRVLAILVFADQEVQNRIIQTRRPFEAGELERVGNYLNAHFAGRPVAEIRATLLRRCWRSRWNWPSRRWRRTATTWSWPGRPG